MYNKFLQIIIIVTFFPLSSLAQLLVPPKNITEEMAVYNVIENRNGKLFEFIDTRIANRFTDGGNEYFKLNYIAKDNNKIYYREAVIIYKITDVVEPISYHQKIFNNNDLVREEKVYFDKDTFFVSLPEDLYPMLGAEFSFRGLDFKIGEKHHFNIWISDRLVYNMVVQVEKIEKVSVPAGSFKCYKVSMMPDLEILTGSKIIGAMSGLQIISSLVPKNYYWFSVEEPHIYVKYDAQFGRPTNLDAHAELIEIKNKPK